MATDTLTKHYAALTAAERFTLTIEAMARGDDPDAERLGDSCPRLHYLSDDVRYRGRMRLAHVIVLKACLNMRAARAQLRLAASLCQTCRPFATAAVTTAQAAFLCGRAFGLQEAGVGISGEVFTPEELDRQLESNTLLREEFDEVGDQAEEAFESSVEQLLQATTQLHACDLLAQWQGLDRFASSRLGVDGVTLAASFGLKEADPTADVYACDPTTVADEKTAGEWFEFWCKRWDRLFAEGAISHYEKGSTEQNSKP